MGVRFLNRAVTDHRDKRDVDDNPDAELTGVEFEVGSSGDGGVELLSSLGTNCLVVLEASGVVGDALSASTPANCQALGFFRAREQAAFPENIVEANFNPRVAGSAVPAGYPGAAAWLRLSVG